MILRTCICIPVYNNPETILSVMEDCLNKSSLPLLVVDDGSDLAIQDLAKSLIEKFQNRIFILRNSQNQGKGVALQKAFVWAVSQNYTHLLTLDGDGQHSADDLAPMLAKSEQNPWALIVGDRNMKTSHVPQSSIFGKKFSNFWIQYETEIAVGDSQSGYRIYPLYHVQTMKFYRKRYDFEIEVLTRLIWKGVEVINVPICVQYFPPEKRVSHFHKFKDNFFISITNTSLVLFSLLSRHRSPLKDSLALALGVFVGVFPVYGLHTLIVAIISFLLRLNFPFLWIGTQVSIPPAVPFLFLGAQQIRTTIFSENHSDLFSTAPDWIFSFFLLALILASLAFVVFYSVTRIQLLRKKQSPATIQQTAQTHLGIRFMNFALKKFGLNVAYFLLYFIVPFYFLLSFKARGSMTEYWKVIRPQIGFFHRQLKIFQQLMSFSRQMVDRAYQNLFAETVFQFDSKFPIQDFLFESREGEKGLVFVNAHSGGWDFAATLFREHQGDKKLRAVMYGESGTYKLEAQSKNTNYQSLYFNQQSHGIIHLKMDLDRGQAVALMSDRPVSKNVELMPFFGKLALFDSTPFKVASMCQAKLCYVFCYKTAKNRFAVNAKLLDLKVLKKHETESRDEFTYRLMLDYVQQLEKELNDYPEQWYNFLPFWSGASKAIN